MKTMGFAEDTLDTVCVSFDKLDKIGADGVASELTEKGMPESAIRNLGELISKQSITLEDMQQYCKEGEEAQALLSLKTIIDSANSLSDEYDVIYDPSLVRGQGYYTGTVFEVASEKFGGTVAGGGRYDGLIGRFTGENVPAVGFSIGFERIFSIVTENNIELAGSRKRTAILYKEEDILKAIAESSRLEAESDVTLILVTNPKKTDKFYSRARNAGFDEIIKLNL